MPAHNEQTKFSEDLIVSDDQERDCHRIERDQYSLTKSKKGYHQYEVMKTPMDDRDSPRQASKQDSTENHTLGAAPVTCRSSYCCSLRSRGLLSNVPPLRKHSLYLISLYCRQSLLLFKLFL